MPRRETAVLVVTQQGRQEQHWLKEWLHHLNGMFNLSVEKTGLTEGSSEQEFTPGALSSTRNVFMLHQASVPFPQRTDKVWPLMKYWEFWKCVCVQTAQCHPSPGVISLCCPCHHPGPLFACFPLSHLVFSSRTQAKAGNSSLGLALRRALRLNHCLTFTEAFRG